jgi:prepilin-type N-terminal cleavage/methylation domain-containing protein
VGQELNMDARIIKWPASRLRRLLWSGQSGFTLIEIIIVLAIMGLLAGVIIPNISGFLGTGTLNAANTELGNVKTASLAYYGQSGSWPDDSSAIDAFIDGTPKATYAFDTATGFVIGVSSVGWSGINWSAPSAPYTQDGRWIK